MQFSYKLTGSLPTRPILCHFRESDVTIIRTFSTFIFYGIRRLNSLIQKSPTLNPILSQLNSFYLFAPYFSKICFNSNLPFDPFHSFLPTQIVYSFLVSPMFPSLNYYKLLLLLLLGALGSVGG